MKCYKTVDQSTPRFQPRTVSLTDQFGSSTTEVKKPSRLCNPVDKNGEGIEDSTAHLMCYDTKERGFVKRDVLMRNQFGDQNLTVVKPVSLCNPATKDMVPSDLDIDHFKCYRVRRAQGAPRFEPRTVTLDDQFESRTVTVVKPQLICNPVDKNGSGIQFPACHFTCYKIQGGPPLTPQDVTVEDQFSQQDLRALRGQCRKADKLCVPSEKNPTSPSGAFLESAGSLF